MCAWKAEGKWRVGWMRWWAEMGLGKHCWLFGGHLRYMRDLSIWSLRDFTLNPIQALNIIFTCPFPTMYLTGHPKASRETRQSHQSSRSHRLPRWRHPSPRRIHGRPQPIHHPQRQGSRPWEWRPVPARIRARGSSTPLKETSPRTSLAGTLCRHYFVDPCFRIILGTGTLRRNTDRLEHPFFANGHCEWEEEEGLGRWGVVMEEPVTMCRVRWSELRFFFLPDLVDVRFAEKNKTFQQSSVLYNISFLAHANHSPSSILFVGEAWRLGRDIRV